MKKQYQYETATIRLPNGKRKYIRAKTKEELKEKVDAVKRELALGVDVSNRTLVKDYAETWFKTVRSVGLVPRTASRFVGLLNNYIYPVIGRMELRDVKPQHIRAVMTGMSHLGHGTQSTVLRMMRDIFDMAVEDQIILRTPVSSMIKARGKTTDEAEPLTPEQETALLEAAKGYPIYTAVYILSMTGLRRGELLGLMWSDVDYDAGVIHVRRHVVPDGSGAPVLEEGAKTKAGRRDVPIPKPLETYLKSIQQSTKSVYVFPNSKGQLYSPAAFSSLWKTLNDRAGFHTHPHQLRHTYATKLFECGLDIKDIQSVMGHADVGITLRTYTHYRAEVRAEKAKQLVMAAFS